MTTHTNMPANTSIEYGGFPSAFCRQVVLLDKLLDDLVQALLKSRGAPWAST
jgi:hypothetical protein